MPAEQYGRVPESPQSPQDQIPPEASPDEQHARELLNRVRGSLPAEVAQELTLQLDALIETVKERTVRLQALEEECRQLEERIRREHRDYVELRASMDDLLDLSELSSTISSSFDIHDILAALMDLSARFLEYVSCGVYLWVGNREQMQAVATRGSGLLQESLEGLREDGIVDWALREGRPVVIEDMSTLDQPGVQEHSFVIVPLRVRGKELGLYALHCARAKDEYTAGQLDLLGVLANQTAVAIDNARLYNDLETAHRRLQESQSQVLLQSKLAAVGELAGGVAHEVNNPLQIILSRVQLMMMQHRDSDRVVDGLRLIETNVKRISRIIRALLGFAGHNLRDEDWAPVDLAAALQQAYALVEHQLDKNLIVTTLECEQDLPPVNGNVGELEQVFINLILNAQNAMPNGGELRISARRDGDRVEMRFADTGVGIAPEHMDRIFEPFFTTRQHSGGTGLGLAVSYGIIEMHHGTITVESEPGHGATFIIRLPLAAER